MFDRYDTSQVVMFAIGSALNQLSEFIDVFGWRSVGLIDPSSSVYNSWRVPKPQAPYPQDYIVDQDGIIRYWSDQYDAQEVIRTIERLLATGVEEPKAGLGRRQLGLEVWPNPAARRISLLPAGLSGPGLVEVCDRAGRVVDRVPVDGGTTVMWDPDLPTGTYFFRLRGPAGEAATVSVLLR
jgi:hypothetical protein